MKTVSAYFVAAVLALLLSGVVVYRIYTYNEHFEKVVQEALETSDGYDQAFIDMVNQLEDELAQRASFGYIGEKDPMTGQKRSIVKPEPIKRTRTYRKQIVKEEVDPFRLAAIIYNDVDEKYTAIIMLGERSMAVEVGDMVAGRKINTIYRDHIDMIDTSYQYRYTIEGKKEKLPLIDR